MKDIELMSARFQRGVKVPGHMAPTNSADNQSKCNGSYERVRPKNLQRHKDAQTMRNGKSISLKLKIQAMSTRHVRSSSACHLAIGFTDKA
jgi:hypothetical protein